MNNCVLKKNCLSHIPFVCLAILCLCMGIATFTELYKGTDFALHYIYNSACFFVLWFIAAITAVIYFVKAKMYKKLIVTGIHLSFILILAGAAITHITSKQGLLHLRNGEKSKVFITNEGAVEKMPFEVCLSKFQIDYYAGSDVAANYKSLLKITNDNGKMFVRTVSMNKILKESGFRLYQTSYDEDMKGTTLSVNYDPWGIPITYTGYFILFITSILWLFNKKGMMRKAMQNINIKYVIVFSVLFTGFQNTQAQNQIYVSRERANEFGELLMNYEGRVTTVETFAKDFVLKITDGKTSYKNLNAEQILTGWILFPNSWENEDVISIKDKKLRTFLGLNRYTSYSKIATAIYGSSQEEILKVVGEKAVQRLSEKLNLIYSVEHGELLKMFPYKIGKQTKWYSYNDSLPASIPQQDADFIHLSMTQIYGVILMKRQDLITGIVKDMKKFQKTNGGNNLPSELQMNCEHILNVIPFTGILYKINLLVGILAFCSIFLKKKKNVQGVCIIISALTNIVLLGVLIMRTIISQHMPLSNGYETIIAVAWFVQFISLIFSKRIVFLNAYGLIGVGFFLLVASLQAADPKITPLMPVLSSPLLAIHVSIIMLAYAFITLSFLVSLSALIAGCNKNKEHVQKQMEYIVKLLLPPGIATLGIGIFVGAIWANISWGNYWSWDSKEVWSLITFIVYGVSLHDSILKKLSVPRNFHLYIVCAYLTVLMTYFGVNMILPGMHSYSGM